MATRNHGVWVHLEPNQLKALDAWIEKQSGQLSRPEAVRRIVETRLNKTRSNHARSSSYSKTELRDAIKGLRTKTPLLDRSMNDVEDYRGRLIGWTIRYSKSRNAREVYNRLQAPQWIIWLNEAAGESSHNIRKAISVMRHPGAKQRKAAEVRKVLPWEQAAHLLFDAKRRR